MARILAIEADPRRKRLLTALVREHVKAELTIADSVHAAIERLAEHTPDLILAPTLLSPQDGATLTAHVRQLDAPYVQMITISAFDMLVEQPSEPRRGLGMFKRRPISLGLQYDPHMVGVQIADGLARAQAMREEHENLQACRALTASRTPTPDAGVTAIALASPADIARVAFGRGTSAEADDRRCARRRAQQDVPWLSDIRLPWGVDVHLVNISSTGLLIESGSKLTPGVTLDLRLSGPDTAMLVKARFVRSEVARIDGRGVRYHAAAEFEKALDFLARREAVKAPSSNQALAELLASVLADSDLQLEPAAVRFARGLRKLVGARDVLVRNAPIAPVDDSESIYFHVRGDSHSRSILQVMFERDRALTEGEFRLLKAAASLTAAVLELETPLQSAGSRAADMPLLNVEEPVAVVA